jgi:hypothetical protein
VVFMCNFKEPKKTVFLNKALIYERAVVDKAIIYEGLGSPRRLASKAQVDDGAANLQRLVSTLIY